MFIYLWQQRLYLTHNSQHFTGVAGSVATTNAVLQDRIPSNYQKVSFFPCYFNLLHINHRSDSPCCAVEIN